MYKTRKFREEFIIYQFIAVQKYNKLFTQSYTQTKNFSRNSSNSQTLFWIVASKLRNFLLKYVTYRWHAHGTNTV